ncbi:MAG TPA: hypothetical protein VJI46_06915 [Candidatus Nanoarchaeia archaeon]|nr:hypothetical protein [Candidatus Nanoarchaeia archaeon]
MSIISIILFFIYTLGLGHTLSAFFKKSESFIEQIVMEVAFGLGIIPILLVLINLVRIPVDWKVLLALSIIYPLYDLYKNYKKIKITFPKKINITYLILFLLFGITLFMYLKGAFAYPYLEDDDPWSHAYSVKYVAVEKDLYDPATVDFKYTDPYPPAYTGFIAVLHQTSPSLNWTLKFFNSLIISLSILFFFFFAKEFFNSKNKALIATSILVMIPSYLSHFIWAISLTMPILITALYGIEKIKHDNKYWILTAILISSMLVTQPSLALKGSIMIFIYWAIKSAVERKFDSPVFYAMVLGVGLSMLWWIPMLAMHGSPLENQWTGIVEGDKIEKVTETSGKWFNWGGTADRPYTFDDFFTAKEQNMINNPIGIGRVLMPLLIFSVIIALLNLKADFSSKSFKTPLLLVFLLFAFLGVNGARLPVQFFAFRFWMVLALATSLIGVLGVEWISKKAGKALIVVTLIILAGIFYTSFIPKYAINTAEWPPGVGWVDNNQLLVDYEEYSNYLLSLPKNTHVFAFSGKDDFIIGLDAYSCGWCSEVAENRWTLLQKNATEIHQFLKQNKYEYAVMDGMAFKYLARVDGNITKFIEPRLNEMIASGLFIPSKQINGAVFMKLK